MALRHKYPKAIVSALVAGVIAFLSSLLTSLQGPTAATSGFDSVTVSQWLTAALAFFVALGITGGATFRVPYRYEDDRRATVDQAKASATHG
jgi:hypothetical protein